MKVVRCEMLNHIGGTCTNAATWEYRVTPVGDRPPVVTHVCPSCKRRHHQLFMGGIFTRQGDKTWMQAVFW